MKTSLICLGIYVVISLLSVMKAIYASQRGNKFDINDMPFVRGLRNFHTAATKAVDVTKHPFQADIKQYDELSKVVDNLNSSNQE